MPGPSGFARPGGNPLPMTGIAVAGIVLLGTLFVTSGFGTKLLGRHRHS